MVENTINIYQTEAHFCGGYHVTVSLNIALQQLKIAFKDEIVVF